MTQFEDGIGRRINWPVWSSGPSSCRTTPTTSSCCAGTSPTCAGGTFTLEILDTSPLVEETAAFDATMADIVSTTPSWRASSSGWRRRPDEQSTLADLAPEEFVEEVEQFLRDHPRRPDLTGRRCCSLSTC
jgi:hypothetical protein